MRSQPPTGPTAAERALAAGAGDGTLAESAVTVEEYRGALTPLAPDWQALFDPGHPGAVFRSYEWLSAWWNCFSAGREALVLIARAGGRVVGLLPLYRHYTWLGGHEVAFMGEGVVGSDYLGIVCRAGDDTALAGPFAAALAGLGAERLRLDDLDDGDALARALAGRARVALEPRYHCPHVRLAGSFDDYLAARPDGAGAQWRRRLRWLERQPGFAITAAADVDGVTRGLEALFTLHHRRWEAEGGSQALAASAVREFHRCAARALVDRGWARLYLLAVGGVPRAALYGWRHGDRFVFYQAGYDPDWRQRSVGTVLLGHILRDCFAAGLAEFDFLRGTEAYKLNWANGARATVRVRGWGPSLRSRAHEAGRRAAWQLRHAVKRALPEAALGWARRLRGQVSS